MIGHLIKGVDAVLVNGLSDKTPSWTSIFSPDIFPMPPTIHSVVENWKKDYEFCRQFLQGVNPFLIKIVGDIAEVPQVPCIFILLPIYEVQSVKICLHPH